MFDWILMLFRNFFGNKSVQTMSLLVESGQETTRQAERRHLEFLSRYAVKVGEQVVLSDGTVGTVEKFGQRYVHRYGRSSTEPQPGVYEDRVYTWVKLESGKVIQVPNGVTYMMVDNDTFLKRRSEIESTDIKRVVQGTRLSDLPDTPFWETDIVTFQNTYVVVEAVNYDTERNGKISYRLKIPTGGVYPYVAEDYLKLVNRGNLWKMVHGQLVDFKTPAEMADFYLQLGEYHEVRIDNVRWLGPEQCLEIIESGKADLVIAHSITYLSNSLVKLNNALVAEKVRPYMIEELKKALETKRVLHSQ